MVTFTQAFSIFWSEYADFSDRSSRSAFWWWQLWYFIIYLAIVCSATVYDLFLPSIGFSLEIVLIAFVIGTIIPNIALSVRRLHDSGHSGCWWWIHLVPLIGWIVLLVFYLETSADTDADD